MVTVSGGSAITVNSNATPGAGVRLCLVCGDLPAAGTLVVRYKGWALGASSPRRIIGCLPAKLYDPQKLVWDRSLGCVMITLVRPNTFREASAATNLQARSIPRVVVENGSSRWTVLDLDGS